MFWICIAFPSGRPRWGNVRKADKGGAASGEGKVSTNGRRMRGLPFLKMQDSVRLCVYRELRKSRTLFVKMIFRISLPLIRLGIRRATFPPRGRLFIGNTTTPQSPSPTNISVTPYNPKRVRLSLNHSPFTIHHSLFTVLPSPAPIFTKFSAKFVRVYCKKVWKF